VAFVGVLWVISSPFVLRLAEHDYSIPGYMVWAAVIYAGIGSLLSYWVGHGLIRRNAERYAQEAELRFSLVRVNEHLDGISLAGGEAGEVRRVEHHLAGVLVAMRRLVTGLTNLTWVTAGFGWVTQIAAIIVAAPLYFQGTLTFGGLMMAAAAFNQTQSSLRWFVDNFSSIADWRATLLRVASFRRALLTADTLAETESRISYEDGPPGELRLDEIEVTSLSGRDMLREQHLRIGRGERLLIVAHPGTSKTQLFRALAGLWPWGSGRITRPKDEPIFYLPRGTPYLPRGTLREVLAYPGRAEDFTESAYLHALRRMGLERLIPMLSETYRWERQLSQDEQLSLAVARIVLQRPPWLIVDDTFDSLDRETLERVVEMFANELERTSVIQIRSAALRDPLFSRVAHLVRVPSTAPNVRRAALPLALLLGLMLLWPAARPAAAAEQMFSFNEPTSLSDAATSRLMRDLALRVLPVYQDLDRDRFLATLSALQMVTGDYTAAYGARQALRQRLKGASPTQPIEQSVVYDLYARTRALEVGQHEPFGRAFSQSFDAIVPPLDDLTDYVVTSWFSTPLSVFQDALQSALASVRGDKNIPLSKALELIWAYLAYQVHLYTGPQADELIAEDDQFRYIIDDQVLIRLPNGIHVPALLVRPRGAAARLPTLLEFTIYRDPENYAIECAAHGYVGVVAYTSGRLVGLHSGVLPYERDGVEAGAVIGWIVRQPWSDGRVAMYGTGYSAFTAWAAAKHAPLALKAIAVSSAIAPGIDVPMIGGVFLNSAYRFAREASLSEPFNPLMEEDESYWRELNQAWYRSGRPYDELDVLAHAPSRLFHRWLNHPSYDRYWQALIPNQQEFAHIRIPVLSISGYYANDEVGTLYYLSEQERYAPRAEHTLVIGPYDDGVLQQGPSAVLRGLTVDPAALVDLHELRYRWFDSILRGGAMPPLLQGRVNFEVSGSNQWRHAPSLASMAGGSLRFYLDEAASDLRLTAAAGEVAAAPASTPTAKPAASSAPARAPAASTPATNAPAARAPAARAPAVKAPPARVPATRPPAAAGRSNAAPMTAAPMTEVHLLATQRPGKVGFVQQSVNFADRSDADWTPPSEVRTASIPTHYSVVFASAPFQQPTELSGVFSGQLDLLLNKVDLDLTLALYERLPDGSYLKLFDPAVELRASYARDRSHRHLLTRGARQQLLFHSDRLFSRRFAAGSRLVLVLSVNKRPDQELNYGNGQPVGGESIADAKPPLTIRWYDSSYIDVPAESPAPPH
jgi:putative CocE/NonD family hydrolase